LLLPKLAAFIEEEQDLTVLVFPYPPTFRLLFIEDTPTLLEDRDVLFTALLVDVELCVDWFISLV